MKKPQRMYEKAIKASLGLNAIVEDLDKELKNNPEAKALRCWCSALTGSVQEFRWALMQYYRRRGVWE